MKIQMKEAINTLIDKFKVMPSKKRNTIAAGIAMVALIGSVAAGVAMDDGEDVSASEKMAVAAESAYSILVNGQEIVKLPSEADANTVLEQVKNTYITAGAEVLESSFAEEVVVTPAALDADMENLMSTQEAITLIVTGNKEPKTYVVQGGDTVWDIAIENNLSPYELMEMNPGVEDKVSIGQTLNLYQVKPYVTVKTKEVILATEKIEYTTQYENSSNLYKGQSQVKVAGNFGSKNVKSEVVKENGLIVASTTLEEEITAEPTTQVTIVGTKTIPIQTGTGQLGVPVTNIEISSAYGSRGGSRHLGVDLRMPKGSPIMAADSGTVTKASYSGSFGNLIIISHGNGIETYYSHGNSINVSTGQNVTKGDVIGTVGSTGNATGNHLHFEVRLDGIAQNPMNYF